MKVHKRLLSLLLTAIMLTAMLVFAGGDIYAKSVVVKNEAEFLAALNNSTIDTLTIKGDFTLSKTVYITRTLTLLGTGKITINGYNYLSVGSSQVKGNLTLADQISIKGNDLVRVEDGTFTLAGKASLTSAGTAVESTNTTMDISGNLIAIKGGSINAGAFGIVARGCSLGVSGGTIIAGRDGININYNSFATITGGVIHSSSNNYYDAGVSSSGRLTISDNANIKGPKSVLISGSTYIISSNTLKLKGPVSFQNIYGRIGDYLNQPPLPITMKTGNQYSFSISGIDKNIIYSLRKPPSELNASITGDTVTIAPTKAGTYQLRLQTYYVHSPESTEPYGLNLIIPVTVTDTSTSSDSQNNSSSTITSQAPIPETGALPVYPYLIGFVSIMIISAGSLAGYKYHKRSKL